MPTEYEQERTKLLAEILENVRNENYDYIPPDDSPLTVENILDFIDAVKFNNSKKLTFYYTFYFTLDLRYLTGLYHFFDLGFYPFTMPDYFVQLPKDFVFTLDNLYFYLESDSGKQRAVKEMNAKHSYLWENGYEPYYHKASGDNTKYSNNIIATKKNRHYSPLNFKVKYLDYKPSDITLHNAFNFQYPKIPVWDPNIYWKDNEVTKWRFNTSSYLHPSYTNWNIKYARSLYSVFTPNEPIQSYKIASDGKTKSYISPSFGFFEDTQVIAFWGGHKTPKWDNRERGIQLGLAYNHKDAFPRAGIYNFAFAPEESQYVGYRFDLGFDLIDTDDKVFNVKNKVLLIYVDRTDEIIEFLPNGESKCCLAECFGITE